MIDPNLYPHSSQKMYRLVNIGGEMDLNNGHPMHHVLPNSPPRKKKMTQAPSANATTICPTTSHQLPQRTMGDDSLMLDDIGETIVIEQGDRMLIDQGHVVNGGDTMIVHHNTGQQHNQPHVVHPGHGPVRFFILKSNISSFPSTILFLH